MEEQNTEKPQDFIRTLIADDVANQKNKGRVHTRFPRNQTDTSTWVTPKVFVLILGSPKNLMAYTATYDLMTRTLPPRK